MQPIRANVAKNKKKNCQQFKNFLVTLQAYPSYLDLLKELKKKPVSF